jgi:5,10-methylenetetrahydromethanopterin reductase
MTSPFPALGVTLGHTGEDVRCSQHFALTAEQAGLDLIGFGDSQTVFREVYAELTACALATERIALGTVVTNCVTRIAPVTASAIVTVHEIAGGRAFLGIGTGQSATANAGVPRGTVDDLRTYVRALRRLHGREVEETTTPDGPPVPPLTWHTGSPPLIVHSNGPRTTAVATGLGDGILLRLGDTAPGELAARIADIRNLVATNGHDPAAFRVWLYTPGRVTQDAGGGVALAGLVSARAVTLKDTACPADLLEPLRRYRSGYDYTRHASTTDPANARLLEQLGLFDYMAERFALIGSARHVADRLRALRGIGVDAVVFGGAVPDKSELIHSLGDLRTSEHSTMEHSTTEEGRPTP